jgi:hypothetical protein
LIVSGRLNSEENVELRNLRNRHYIDKPCLRTVDTKHISEAKIVARAMAVICRPTVETETTVPDPCRLALDSQKRVVFDVHH